MLTKRKLIAAVVILLIVVVGTGLFFVARSKTVSALNFTSADGSISIRADKLTISGGIGSVPELTNAYIDVFDRSDSGSASSKDLSIEKVLSRDHFSSFPGGKPSKIKARPISVKIYKGEAVVTQFFASEGEIDLEKGRVILVKEARSLSGNTLLIADKIVFSPASSTISADRFVLQKPDKRIEGSSLTLDAQLLPQTGAANAVR